MNYKLIAICIFVPAVLSVLVTSQQPESMLLSALGTALMLIATGAMNRKGGE